MELFLNSLRTKIDNGDIKYEFKKINQISMYIVHDTSIAKKHPEKNKYSDILAQNDTRIKLHNDGYINANYYNKYILAQGPIHNYINEFWEMVYNNSTWIISLAIDIEGGKNKYDRYFEMTPQTYGDYYVTLKESQSFMHSNDLIFNHNKISAIKDNKEKTINHIQFYKWPDHSIPHLDHFLYMYNHILSQDINDTMTIHCSAGIGRTGTFCMIDTIINLVKNGKYDIKFDEILLDIRNHRDSCVQTEEQYAFIHRCILTYFSNLA